MLRFLTDENFHSDVSRGLIRRLPNLDILRVQDVGLANTADPLILEWAAQQGRIVLTHDVTTMPAFAEERIEAGLPMPGLIAASARLAIGRVIEDLSLLAQASYESELNGQILDLPL